MNSFKYTINGNVYRVVLNRIDEIAFDVEVNGKSYKVEIAKPAKKKIDTNIRPAQTPVEPVILPHHANLGVSALQAPLPGLILDIFCKVGDKVKKGQNMLILEAMKMENAICSEREGVVKQISVKKGDTVLEGAELVIIG